MKNAIINYENTFYINGVAISGVSSVEGSYSLDYKPINVIGKGFTKQVIASVPTANLSISRYLINNDPVFNLTGDGANYLAESVSGGLNYKNKYFSFESGYLNSFNISCSVGEVPQISSTFDIYGDIGPLGNPSGANNYATGVFVPQVKNITITCRNSSTNRVKDFNITFNCPNLPIYGLSANNAEFPIEVQNMLPLEVTSAFTLDVDDYETKKVFDDLTTAGTTSFVIKISGQNYDNNDGLLIMNFTGSNAKIVNEQISSSADDVLSVKLTYKTYLN